MNKFLISFAAASFVVGLAPTANAYGAEPEPRSVAYAMFETAQERAENIEGACVVKTTPILAAILDLPNDWSETGSAAARTALACNEE